MIKAYLLLLAAFAVNIAETEYAGECSEPVGTRCYQTNKPWQYDGVCSIEKSKDTAYCMVTDSQEFKFEIVARLRSLKLQAAPLNELWIRGEGPGLSWDESILMKKSASSIDAWQSGTITYTASSSSLQCLTPSQCSQTQTALHFRIYKNKEATGDMLGPNFYVQLPTTESLSGAATFLTPTVTVHPWFDSKTVTQTSFSQETSTIMHLGKPTLVKGTLFVPPSFDNNIRKTYSIVIVFSDESETDMIASLLEHMYVHEASIEEALVVSIHFSDKAPFCFFSPFKQRGSVWKCDGNGAWCHHCQTCWNVSRTQPCDAHEFREEAAKCFQLVSCAGKGEDIITYLHTELVEKVNELAENRVKKGRMSIIGYDGAGLLACYAAIKYPSVFVNAGCLSAPFHWPMSEGLLSGDALIEEAIETETYSPQIRGYYAQHKFYIDIGDKDGFYFPVINIHQKTEKFISVLTDNLLLSEKNIQYMIVPNTRKSHYHNPMGRDVLFHRIKYPLLFFLKPKGNPSRAVHVSQSQPDEPDITKNKIIPTQIIIGETEKCETTDNMCPTEGIPLPIFIGTIGKCHIHHFAQHG